MKKLIISTLCLLLLATGLAKAQNILQQSWNTITSTNAAVDFEALRGLKGNKDIFAATYAYGMTTNAALLVSYDEGYTKDNVPDNKSTSLLKGGLSLSASVKPFENWFGVTNFVVRVDGYEEAGVETSGPNSGQAVNVAGGFVDTQFAIYKALYFHVGALYQNRTQQGTFGGNYAGVRGGLGGSF